MRKIATITGIIVLLLLVQAVCAQRVYEGVIEKLTPSFRGEWVISGKTVYVTKDTKVNYYKEGWPKVGCHVLVKGVNFEGKYVAFEIGPKEIFGTVQKLPERGFIGEWVIDGKTIVHVTPNTKLSGPAEVGLFMKAEVEVVEGKYVAYEIRTLKKFDREKEEAKD